MSKWQPIDTAPCDGTVVLLTNPTAGGSWVGKFQDVFQSGWCPDNPWWNMMLNMEHLPNAKSWRPTHWQPMPAAVQD